MSAHFQAIHAAIRRGRSLLKYQTAFLVVAMLGVLTSACGTEPLQPYAGRHPADPTVPVPRARYSSPIGSYVSQRPTEPRPWREQNEQVAPQPKQ